jgi:hypothetical protein
MCFIVQQAWDCSGNWLSNDAPTFLGEQRGSVSRVDGGVVSSGLDEFLINDERSNRVPSLANDALDRSDGEARRRGEPFIAPLAGKLRTTASSPFDYLTIETVVQSKHVFSLVQDSSRPPRESYWRSYCLFS